MPFFSSWFNKGKKETAKQIDSIPQCKDCKFAINLHHEGIFAKCSASPNSSINEFTGFLDYGKTEMPYCDTERTRGKCGKSGKNFQPK